MGKVIEVAAGLSLLAGSAAVAGDGHDAGVTDAPKSFCPRLGPLGNPATIRAGYFILPCWAGCLE